MAESLIASSGMADHLFNQRDARLIAALQCDGRAPAERVAAVLGLSTRVVQQRWAALSASGAVQVAAGPPRPSIDGVMILHIRVLRGRLDPLSKALARRPDVPLIELSTSGDQLVAIVMPPANPARQSLLDELPTSSAIVNIEAETIIHVFSDASDWTADYLSAEERQALTPQRPALNETSHNPVRDTLDEAIAAKLMQDARLSAAAIARSTGQPESTVRRRLNALLERRELVTQVAVDPKSLGFPVDADLRMQVSPERLDHAGRTLAAHPAVHGALATTGHTNLTIAVWLRDLEHLYHFITHDLADLGVSNVDTLLIGRNVKRPSGTW
jgi:DNA-binding Lrp family transcriptional regulator